MVREQPWSNECIVWPYARAVGYGYVRHDGRVKPAHRVVCALAYGRPANGHEVAHSCGNRACVNPAHLRWAIHRENGQDTIAHGRAGRDNRSKLTAAKVVEIRAMLAKGVPHATIAERYGVRPQSISAIACGTTWAHVP